MAETNNPGHEILVLTVKHLIFAASKFGNFKRLMYWCSLILPISQFNDLLSFYLFSRGYWLREEYVPYGEHIQSFNSSPFYDMVS